MSAKRETTNAMTKFPKSKDRFIFGLTSGLLSAASIFSSLLGFVTLSGDTVFNNELNHRNVCRLKLCHSTISSSTRLVVPDATPDTNANSAKTFKASLPRGPKFKVHSFT